MLTKKAALLTALTVVLTTYGISRAESQENDVKSAIVFNDSSHATYFKYQSYLIQHGKSGYSAQSWASLPESDRIRKVTEGETFLTTLHGVLLGKGALSPGEQELLAAVWGTNAAPNDIEVARRDNAAKEHAKRIAEQARKISETGSWGAFFDGSTDHAQGVSVVKVPAVDASYSSYPGSAAPAVSKPEAHPYPSARLRMLPAEGKRGDAPHSDGTLPYAVATLVVAGAAAAFALKRRPGVEGAKTSAAEVQLNALSDMAQDPQRMYDFLRDPEAYSKANNASFDPEVMKMVHSALSRHEQDIESLLSGNKYRTTGARLYMTGSTADAVSTVVANAAACIAAAAATLVVLA